MVLAATLSDTSGMKAPILFLTQSCDPIVCNRKLVERSNEIGLVLISSVPSIHWLPVATDGTARLDQRVDRGLSYVMYGYILTHTNVAQNLWAKIRRKTEIVTQRHGWAMGGTGRG